MESAGAQDLLVRIEAIAADFAHQRPERQRRTRLDPADFAQLADAGFLLAAVPASHGGLWRELRSSLRPVCRMLRTLARVDGSLALVAAMHPSVLVFWLSREEPEEPWSAAWRAQRSAVFDSARAGAWWGTITSEPGSGGDILKTRAEAAPREDGEGYLLTGDKHFGSGSGITSHMITTARVEGSRLPDLFFLDVAAVPWDGSSGMQLVAEWDGLGMAATQSHAFHLEAFPATRIAWPGAVAAAMAQATQLSSCAFTAVCAGIVDAALTEARRVLAPRAGELRAFEKTEWTRAANEAWLVTQAHEGMLRAVEEDPDPAAAVAHGKAAVARLAEALTTRLCRVVGGGSYSRRSPFGFWAEDVRALGFLRPPWALAFEQLYALSLVP